LFSLGNIKKNQFLIGFALETENEIENANKIQKKLRFDCLNSQDQGFWNLPIKLPLLIGTPKNYGAESKRSSCR
jgi:hypothetical protein